MKTGLQAVQESDRDVYRQGEEIRVYTSREVESKEVESWEVERQGGGNVGRWRGRELFTLGVGKDTELEV